MNISKHLLIFVCWLLGVGIIISFNACQSHQPVDFSTQIKPILNSKCISCHGGVKKQGGFSLLFEEEAFEKLPSGKYGIVAGNPGKSEMIRRLTLDDPEERMPYEEDRLSEEEIDLLTRWVKEGAKWGEHWAYQPVESPTVPTPSTDWGQGEIDAFIIDKMEEVALSPSPQADPKTLLRRVSLDLIGFPAPDSIKAPYLANPSPENYEKLVDDLLASPHFGEKWASMWLDLARYADTKGYERDDKREIWRYRDWVIKAFNQDKPYDEFITEQLAGDLLPNPTEDQYVATAFHRNTMTNDEGGTDNEEFRTAAVMDRVSTTWEVLMSTTFACVQCHGHPYDPFKHEEYYEFAAFFNNTRDEDTFEDYPLFRHYPKDKEKDLKKIQDWVQQHATPVEQKEVMRFVKTLVPSRHSLTTDEFVNAELGDTKWLVFRNNASARLKAVHLQGKDKLLMSVRVQRTGGTLKVHVGSPKGKVIASKTFIQKTKGWWDKIELDITPTDGVEDIYFTYSHYLPDEGKASDRHLTFDWFYFKEELPGSSEKGFAQVKSTFMYMISDNVPVTPIMIENPESLTRTTQVFERGNRLVLGDTVTPKVPDSMNPFPEGAPANRLGLAQWIMDPQHPLTSRTMTNRLWEQLFGYGLVETLEDMGTQGAEATHQELLDYLSAKFIHQYKWSMKAMIREMVLSATYQQSSKVLPQHLEIDAKNLYLARMPRVRLSAEQIRDQALFVAGKLNPKMYGPPVMPFQPEGIWNSPYNGAKWKKSKGDKQYRRAIYTYWKRTSPYPSVMTFDGVGREVCSSRRIRTNTPLQALVTLNDSVYVDLSRKLVQKVWQSGEEPQAKISQAYAEAAGKEIDEDKLTALVELYDTAYQAYKLKPEAAKNACIGIETESPESFAALALVANSIINLDEVISKN